MPPPKPTFAAALRRELDRANLTQSDLARQAGVARQVVSKLLAGTSHPQWDTVKAIAAALGVSADVFPYYAAR